MKTSLLITFLFVSNFIFAKDIFVSVGGKNSNNGTQKQPFASFERAVQELEKFAGEEPINVWFGEGTYYLSKTILLESKMSGSADHPIVFSALPGEKVSIKGSKLLSQLKWSKYKDSVYVTDVPEGLNFDQLFVNGERKIRARFPNYDDQNPLRGGKGYLQVTGGTDCRYDKWFGFDPEMFTQKVWENPKTGIVHAFQSHNWGNMQYRINSVNHQENKVFLGEGGWQLQRRHGIGGSGEKSSWYFIDNIFEELDVANEWFLDADANKLYYYPGAGENINTLLIEVPIVKDLIQLKGTSESPVKYMTIKGFNFTQSALTYMEQYEPLARGDWAIHRGGAIFMEGAENCVVQDCNFDMLGGNGVFMSSYNRNNAVKSCRFVNLGESAVCFVGSPSAVRFYQTWDDSEIYGKDWNQMRKGMDMNTGPKSPDYPKECAVENCIMHDFGDWGKQVAGVYISMSHKIRVSHNTIYNCPRAGICINDGTWGGHVIEYCDIWETVRETGEHGPLNSWGRERQWKGSRGSDEHFLKELTKLDAIDNVIIRNNRIANYRKSISAGNWTIDLDDGSSYFEIYNNLNLGSTIKLRDGMARKVHNNITVSAVPLGWHVWPKNSQDEIYQNIFVISGAVPGKGEATRTFIRPIGMPTETKWSTHYNNNLYWNINYPDHPLIHGNTSLKKWQDEGYDQNSVLAEPLFIDPKNGNYQVQPNSPALKLGFKNFPMDQFGHQMTRMEPFSGEFENETSVILHADHRAGNHAKVYYTLDGSQPSTESKEYIGQIKLSNSTTLKAQTFDANGIPVGFVAVGEFVKVNKVSYPSWYGTLLAGAYSDPSYASELKAFEEEIYGALLVNIADDPDLIDGTGGYNSGCYIKSLHPQNAKIWLNAGLTRDWVIQEVNGRKVQNISELKWMLNEYKGEIIILVAGRDYHSKEFKVNLP